MVEMVGPKKSRFPLNERVHLLGRLLRFLGKKHGLDVGQNTSLSNGDAGQQFVQLLVIAHSKLQVTGNDPALLIVAGSIACQLEYLGCEVFHNSCEVHGGTSANSLGIVALPQVTMDTSHGELEPSPRAPGLALSLCLASFTASRHADCSSATVKMMPQRARRHLFIQRGEPFVHATAAVGVTSSGLVYSAKEIQTSIISYGVMPR